MKPFDYQSKIQDLKLSILRSEAFELKNNPDEYITLDKLCQEMAKLSLVKDQPIKSSFNGKEFVIPARTAPIQAMEDWVDQTMNLENYTEKDLKDFMNQAKDGQDYIVHNLDDTSREVINRKVCEALVQKNPANAEKLDTIQLMDLHLMHYTDEKSSDSPNYQKMAIDSAERYMQGEKTFEPTIYNVSKMNDLQEMLYRQGKYSMQEVEARMSQTETAMLQRVDLDKISHSKDSLKFVDKIAAKHPEEKIATTLRRGILDIKMSKLSEQKKSNIR